MFQDSYIEYWGEIYTKLKFDEYQVSFDSFLYRHEEYLRTFGQESAPYCIDNGFEPLLPEQAAVVVRLREKEEATCTLKIADEHIYTNRLHLQFEV